MPFTVDELVRLDVEPMDACMIVWPVSEEAFAEYVAQKEKS